MAQMQGKLYESLVTKFVKTNPFTSTDEVSKTRNEHRQLVKTAIGKIKTQVEKGEMKVGIGDIDKLMRLDLLLMGEPDSNSQNTPGFDAIEQQRVVVACLDELKPEEKDFLCGIMAKIVNAKNVLASQPPKPPVIEVKPVEVAVEQPVKKVVPRTPTKTPVKAKQG